MHGHPACDGGRVRARPNARSSGSQTALCSRCMSYSQSSQREHGSVSSSLRQGATRPTAQFTHAICERIKRTLTCDE
eukprot:6117648-Pleurochrysis_carterae.AAC.1